MKTELFYGRLDPERLTVEELKSLVWRYFMSYWNRRRICSANGGLPPAVKRQRYFAALGAAAKLAKFFEFFVSTDIDKIIMHIPTARLPAAIYPPSSTPTRKNCWPGWN